MRKKITAGKGRIIKKLICINMSFALAILPVLDNTQMICYASQDNSAILNEDMKSGIYSEAQIEKEADTEIKINIETEKESEPESNTEQNNNTEPNIESETDIEQSTESETETEQSTEIESETEQNTEVESETETEQNTEVESETETEQNSEIESETETEQSTEIESETEKKSLRESYPEVDDEILDIFERFIEIYPDAYIDNDGYFVVEDEDGKKHEYDPYDPEFDKYIFNKKNTEIEDVNNNASSYSAGTNTSVSPFTGKTYNHEAHVGTYKILNGIDVSKYQADIDWNKARAAGVEFAFVRIGYRGYSKEGKIAGDEYAIKNIKNAYNAGVKVGAYFFSQAITAAEAAQEATYCRNYIEQNGLKSMITMPVIIDYEYTGPNTARLRAAKLSPQQHQTICDTFCNYVRSYGYKAGIYANFSMLTNDMIPTQSNTSTQYWIARYNTYTDYKNNYSFWQYSSSGRVDGINGDVDCNFWYFGRKDINDPTCHINISDVIDYTEDISQIITIYDSSSKRYLVKDKDYKIGIVESSTKTNITFVIEGIGKYKGKITKTTNMSPMPLNKNMVSYIDKQIYTGSPITTQSGLNISILYENKKLIENTDYILSYENNINSGKATVTVTGKGFYYGTVIVTFNIIPKSIATAFVSDIADMFYTGNKLTIQNNADFKIEDREIGKTLVEAADYTLKYSANKNAGTAKVTITGKGNYDGSITKEFKILPISIGNALEVPMEDVFVKIGKTDTRQEIYKAVYNGKNIKPAVEVVKAGKKLESGKDYTIKYDNNKQIGNEAQVIIEGRGNYTGIIKAYFSIIQKPVKITDKMISLASSSMQSSGSALNPEVYVVYNGKRLVLNKDYTISYKNSRKEDISEIRQVGNYYIAVSGIGDYSGSVLKSFKVINSEKTIIGKEYTQVTLDGNEKDRVFNNTPIKPSFIVKNIATGYILQAGKDYTVSYIDNKDAGEARFVIKGKGEYTGSYTGTFIIAAENIGTITADDMSLSVQNDNTQVSINKNEFNFNGKKQNPSVKIKTVLVNGKSVTLKSGKDFDISVENMSVAGDSSGINAGKYQMHINLKGNYTGQIRFTYNINKIDISKLNISVPKQAYNGAQICPSIDKMTVKIGSTIIAGAALNGIKLSEWSSNSEVNKKAGFVVSAESDCTNFTYGSSKKVYFTIERKAINSESVAYAMGGMIINTDMADVQFTYCGSPYNQQNGAMIAVADTNNVNPILREGIDYTVKYSSNVNAGKAKVTVTGIGSYSGKKNIYFIINKSKIDDGRSCLIETKGDTYTFTGNEIKPFSKFYLDGRLLKNGKDYTVKYSSNVNAGKATITVVGKGNYEGSLSKKFVINPKKIADAKNISIGSIPDQAYTGKVIVPSVTVKVDGRTLNKGKDYTISVINSTRLTYIEGGRQKGIATMTITGTGNYSGTIGRKNFIVVK